MPIANATATISIEAEPAVGGGIANADAVIGAALFGWRSVNAETELAPEFSLPSPLPLPADC